MPATTAIHIENELKRRAGNLSAEALLEAADNFPNFGVERNSNPIVKREALYAYVDAIADKTIAANKGRNDLKSQLIVLSGGSASNVGALVKALYASGTVNKDACLQLDSEAIIESGAAPEFAEMAANGYKHPEKMTQETRRLFHYLLIAAADRYYEKLKSAGVSGSVLIDDHCENLAVPMAIAVNAKTKMNADVGYVCVARDPRLGIESARDRVAQGGGAITPKLQLDTYRVQPRNWDTLSQCNEIFDVAVMAHMNRAYSTVPEIVARRIGKDNVEVLNDEELFCFNATQHIPQGACTQDKVFEKDPHKAYRESHDDGVVRKKHHSTVSFEEALKPKAIAETDSFVTRITKDAAEGRSV